MNKNTKQRKAKALKAFKAQQRVSGGRSSKAVLVISENKVRNMQQLCYRNSGKQGSASITRHEVIDKNIPTNPYKHKAYKKGAGETN